MKTFTELLNKAKEMGKCRLSVAEAADETVLEAVEDARNEGIIDPILVGKKDKVEKALISLGYALKNYTIIEPPEDSTSAKTAVRLVTEGKADLLMKGLLPTAEILREVLNKDNKLNMGKTLSHVAVFKHPNYDRFIFVTDAGLNIAPDLNQKKDIVQNAIDTALKLEVQNPIAAIVCAVEMVNPAMPATIDAAALVKMNERGTIKGGQVEGPLALDNAISIEAAKHKGIKSPLAGKADILVAPDIEAGNILYKSLIFFGNAVTAGLIVGAKTPVVLTSRADSAESKLYSIALGTLLR